MRHATTSVALAGALVLPLVTVPPDIESTRTEVRAVQPAAFAEYAAVPVAPLILGDPVAAIPQPSDEPSTNATSAAASVDWRALISTITSTAAALILAPVVVAFVGLAWVISQIQIFFYNRENATTAAVLPIETSARTKREAPTGPAAVDEEPAPPRTAKSAKSSAKASEPELTKPVRRAATPRPVVRESLGTGERLRGLAQVGNDRRSTTRDTAEDNRVTKRKSTSRATSPAGKSRTHRDSAESESGTDS
ncbi:hypothetical protein ACRCUN_04650 [Mycobacterium sp. LTG2003]